MQNLILGAACITALYMLACLAEHKFHTLRIFSKFNYGWTLTLGDFGPYFVQFNVDQAYGSFQARRFLGWRWDHNTFKEIRCIGPMFFGFDFYLYIEKTG